MKRRTFIKRSSVISLPFLLNGTEISAFSQLAMSRYIDPPSDKVLVLIYLDGGNDGLNTVIPLDQYTNLNTARPNIIIPQSAILPVADTIGFHPSLTGLKSLFDDGKLEIIQSVGYPNQNRSHFRSTDIWNSGSPYDQYWTTGWLGRYFETIAPGFPEDYPNGDFPDPIAMTIGRQVSSTCQGTTSNFSMAINNPESLSPLYESPDDEELPDSPYKHELVFLRNAIMQTNAYGDVIRSASDAGNNLSALYDEENALAQKLKIVARLISGGLTTNVYVVKLGGFDTHANQVIENEPTTGNHADLLKTVSDAIAAFQDDLQLLGLEEKVMGMTYSEFGRQIKSNFSFGSDHGTAGPLFLFGSCVNAQVLGSNPEISADVQPQEGVPMQYDFRSIYGSILMDWFGVAENEVRNLLFDDFQHLPIIAGCSPDGIGEIDDVNLEIFNYPNPFRNSTTIVFSAIGQNAKISVFDALGSELKILANRYFTAGKHEISFDTSDIPAGNYYYRITSGSAQKTKLMVKQR